MGGGAFGNRHSVKEVLLAGVCPLAIMCVLQGPASAATYFVSSDAALRTAIANANAHADPSAVIVMTADFTLLSSLPALTKPMTIDTGAFTLTTIGTVVTTTGSNLTLDGAILGTGAQPAFRSTLAGTTVNNGSITGSSAGSEAIEVRNSSFTNNGIITGGSNLGVVAGGVGAEILNGVTLTNTAGAVIQGGNSQGHAGGIGATVGNPASSSFINNYGTIRGGSDLSGVNPGGVAIRSTGATNPIFNAGLIEGGNGASAIISSGSTNSLVVTNSGTIRAGVGQANAIFLGAGASNTITLELQAGSVIEGNVIANAAVAADIFRLGGTTDATFDVSTIGSQYQNFDTFEKIGASTWSLTGDGSVATPWLVQQGTLQIGNGGTSGSVIGDITNNATLAFNRSDSFTFSNGITGSGTVVQAGSGTTILADDFTYTGPTIVKAGTLAVNGSITSATSVEAGGALGGTGTIFGDVTNAGIVAPGNSIGTLTVAGNYTSNGGALEVETVLGGDASPTDLLVITGNSVLGSGPTQVGVVNLGGTGAATVEGIKIVDIAGVSDAGAFALLGNYVFEGDQAVVGGAYAYRLYQNGVSTPADGDWYLRSTLTNPVTPPGTPPGTPTPPVSPLYQAGVPIYESYANALQNFNGLGTLRQRLGERSWSSAGVIEADLPADALDGVWGRIEASHAEFAPQTTTSGANYETDLWKLQAGADSTLYRGEAGSLIGGLSLEYGTLSADITSPHGDGSINSTGFGVGSTLTWYGSTGFYLDGQARVTWYDSDLSSSTAGLNLATDNGGFGYAVSIEGGQQIALGSNWSITPQAQLAYSDVDFDSFTDAFGAAVSSDNGQSLKARLGISADYRNEWTDEAGQAASANLCGIANLYYDLLEGARTDVAGVKFTSENDPLWGGIGVGGSYNWGDGKYALHGEASLNTSLRNFGDSYAAKGTVGLSVKF